MRLIRVMCTGRIDLAFVIRAFSKGADGVFIGGCHLNECNYITHGNYHALTMVHICKKMMEHMGLDQERLTIEFMSGSEANLFIEGVNNFVKKIKELGPLGKREGMDGKALAFKLAVARSLVPYIKLVERERLRGHFQSEEEWNNFFRSDEFDRLFNETIADKLATSEIVSLLREKPLSTAEIAKTLGLTPSQVSKHLNSSSRQRLVRYDEREKRYALA